MTSEQTFLTRWYIDTRRLTATTEDLPLLETLQEKEQTAIRKYLRLPDRHMSLASQLLKYYFIHRTCRIPWSGVIISRTPKPHQRPCFIPQDGQVLADGSPIPAVEFNVSHQASFVALGGCLIPSSGKDVQSQEGPNDNTGLSKQYTPAAIYSDPEPSSAPIPSIPQVGIDITCVDEPGRRRNGGPKDIKGVIDYIDIFKEVFSQRELDIMKRATKTPGSTTENTIKSAMRLFYAYWALKEAYIKMTGEALLAKWLRELEFTNVVAPGPVGSSAAAGSSSWGEPYNGVQTWLYGKRVEDVRVELIAFETDYLVATAARGANLGSSTSTSINVDTDHDPWRKLESVDIERDIRPCATGNCQCLQ